MTYPSDYRRIAKPETFVFEASTKDGEVIEVRKVPHRVALTPGEVYQSKTEDGTFLLFWAEDIGVAVQRAMHIAQASRADQEANS